MTYLHTVGKVSALWVFLVLIFPFRIRTEYGDFICKSLYLVQMRENMDQKNSKCIHFLHSGIGWIFTLKLPERQQTPLHKKWSFQLRISSVNVTKSVVSCRFGYKIADLVTFTEEIFNGKLHFLCSACSSKQAQLLKF